MGHVAGIEQAKRSYKTVVGKYERKIKLGRTTRRWNIKINQEESEDMD